jgi:hypothetical protein
MKKNLLFIFILAGSFLFAQKKNEGNNFHWVSEQTAIGFVGGQFHPDLTAINHRMDSLGTKSNFYQGLRGYGITITEPEPIIRGGGFDASVSFAMMMKSKVTMGPNDSLYFQMKGWHLMTSFFGKDIIPGKTVALVLAPGFDWGVLKMVRTLSGNGTLYKNGFIAPLGRAELRFVFGPVALGARYAYRYDLTKDSWKIKSGPAYALPGTKNTGTSIEFFVGWGHVHYQ